MRRLLVAGAWIAAVWFAHARPDIAIVNARLFTDVTAPPPAHARAAPGDLAIVNANVIRMHSERVDPGQTVIVSGGRIAAIGDGRHVRVPEGATVIDGSGRYLVPGLTDAHVHLATDMPWAPTRPDFGDAPLYLAHGVTTVINLRGTPLQLEWRQRIEAGELLGPTIYTAGEFVNEPHVRSPDDVRREIAAQRRAGYDVIKFHEAWTAEEGYITTSGLSLETYLAMNEAARRAGMPLVGHAPVNLGLDALLSTGQPLAHVGTLSNIYFLPLASHRRRLLLTAVSLLTLIVAAAAWALAALVARGRGTVRARSRRWTRARVLAGAVLLASLLALTCALFFLAGGPLFESVALRLVFTGLSVIVAGAAIAQVIVTLGVWRNRDATMIQRAPASLLALASVVIAFNLTSFGVPLAWRSANAGIESLAQRIRQSGISVQTTLINYDVLSPDQVKLTQDPAIAYLSPQVRATWRQMPPTERPGYRYHLFMRKVAGALHRAGVPLVAGTDAMGLPFIVPGSSLHGELERLVDSGLTPYEAIRAATVNPARFLRKEHEFGTIDVGKRADLLIVDGNPLRDLTVLRKPVGVVVRGRWLAREHLEHMLAGLAREG